MTAMPETNPVFEFITDPNAQPGNVVPALARLLIDMVRSTKKENRHKEGKYDGNEYAMAV